MVRFVFRANKLMKIGVLLMGVAACVLIASVVMADSVALRATGVGILIVSALVYMAGRMKQIMGQRPR